MKGLEISISTIIIVVIVVLVLTVVGYFFFGQSTNAMSTTDATRVFAQACVNIHCTTTKGFCQGMLDILSPQTDFWKSVVGACKTLYGYGEENIAQCMKQCQSCKNTDIDTTAVLNSIKSHVTDPNVCNYV